MKTYELPDALRARMEALLPAIQAQHPDGYLYRTLRDVSNTALRLGLEELKKKSTKPQEESGD